MQTHLLDIGISNHAAEMSLRTPYKFINDSQGCTDNIFLTISIQSKEQRQFYVSAGLSDNTTHFMSTRLDQFSLTVTNQFENNEINLI